MSSLKNLMLIRNNTEIRAKYWQLIDQILAQIMLDGKGIDPDFTGLYRINVSKIIENHAKLDQLEKAVETARISSEKLQHLMKQKNDLEIEFKDITTKFEELKLKVQNEEFSRKLKNPEIDTPVSTPSATSPVPVAPPPMNAPPPPPGISNGPPPPPGLGPPPPPGAGAKLKPKKQYAPQVKLKQIQWDKIPEAAIENTIWKSINDEEWEQRVDFKEIETLFAMKSSNVVVKTKVEEVPAEISLINSKKSYGITIMLGRLKHSFYEIRKAILQMNSNVMTDILVKQFLNFVPTAEEIGMLSVYKDDTNNLAKADSFLVEMIKINRYEPRLRGMLFKYSYAERYNNIVQEVDSVINSVRSIKNSSSFQKLLEIVLLVGNYMNSNSFKAKAYGFKISNINKLVDTKTADNKKTLLNYLVGFIEEKHPEILKFCEDIKSVDTACRVSFQFLESEMNDIRHNIKEIKNELEIHFTEKPNDPLDKYKEIMESFLAQVSCDFTTVEKNYTIMNELYIQLVQLYGEDPVKIQSEEFFGIFKTFVSSFEKALNDNRKEKEKKKETKRDSTIRKQPLTVEPLNVEDDEKGMMDDLLNSLKHGNGMDMKVRVERRRKNSVTADQALGLLEKLKSETK